MVSASVVSVGVGTVNTGALHLRDEANISTTILGTASKNDTVVVLGDVGNGWYKVGYKPVEGYMSGEYLNVSTKADVTIGYGLIQSQGSPLNVRSGPGTSYGKVTFLSNDAMVNIVGIDSGWYKISTNGIAGYVSSNYMVTCKNSAGSHGDGATAVATTSSSSPDQQVVGYTKQYLDYPYMYGSSGPNNFGCSGYTSYVYRHFGYTLDRTASTQFFNGTSIFKNKLQPGNLVSSKYNTSKTTSRVGTYIGGGRFVHASTSAYTIKISDLTRGHCVNVYVGARRVL